ncbi:hypothetical protein [Staphylococcus saprophyticus]|uniref:hypothetical protein n=1 Tax=Staphylococcus saprophyticus TaxID=29385 RepID=UPI0030C0453E
MSNQALNIVPTRENTVISDEQVAKIKPIFARVPQLSTLFALSESTVTRYVREAEESKYFSYIVKRPSPSILIIEIDGFRNFLDARQKRSFSKISI